MSIALKPPFPYFGGKHWLAPQIWRWLGPDVKRYIEPFAGGMAVLLARPGATNRPRWQEVVNDEYAHICNVWRSIKHSPEAVWDNCKDPLHEADMHGRTQHIIAVEPSFREAMFADPVWCDPQVAGWWIWCQSAHLAQAVIRSGYKAKPNSTAQGVFSQAFCREFLERLTSRLQTTQILCGDFGRALTPAFLASDRKGDFVGVYLDPPYVLCDDRVYNDVDHGNVWARTVRWAAENCGNPCLRIVLSGYRGSVGQAELEAAGMVRFDFSAPGGHDRRGANDNQNHTLESCWASPACVNKMRQADLFEVAL